MITDDQKLRIKCLHLAASYHHEDHESALQWAQQFYEFARGDGLTAAERVLIENMPDDLPPADSFPDMTAAKQAVAKQAAYEAERKAHRADQREADITDLRGVRLHCGPHCRAGLAPLASLKCDCGELETVKASVGKELDGNGERG